jgi:phosphoribosylanthranilate isomerase
MGRIRRIRVKICGITREEDLSMVTSLGADAVGFVVGVPSSPRNISLKKAGELIRQVPIFVKSVLVVVSKSTDHLLKICEMLRPDALQIHGEKLPDTAILREKLPTTSLIRGLNANPFNVFVTVLEAKKAFDVILLDSFQQQKYGGTGIIHDWELSKRVKQAIQPKFLILAGGLNPDNVREAIHTVKPYAVDVSTGVESYPGIKDPKRIASFIENIRGIAVE